MKTEETADLIKITELKNKFNMFTDSRLDELVHELKSSEASCINNQGAREQIEYIVEEMGREEAIKKLEELLK